MNDLIRLRAAAANVIRRAGRDGATMSVMTRNDVREASAQGKAPDLWRANLRGIDLRGANFCGANLREANLYAANLRGADLRGANFYRANLRGTDLRGASLRWADLWGANFCGADLRETDLREADLYAAVWDGLVVNGLPSGNAILVPTCDGWDLSVGCWQHQSVTDFRALISGTDWPLATGDEQDRRRPGLAALADLCDAHIAANPGVIEELAEKWGFAAKIADNKEEEENS